MGTFHILDGKKVKVYFRGNRSTCGWCHADASKCQGGAIARICKEKGGAQVHIEDHMKALWTLVQFDPQTFNIEEVQYDDIDIDDSLGGDRKVLNNVHFPRTIDRLSISQSESDNFNVLRIKNFPNDISDEDIVDFLKDEVDDTIGSSDIKSEKTKYNTNVYLGPGPSLLVIKKAAKLWDFKTVSRTFLNGR